jgi:hypothetical protein
MITKFDFTGFGPDLVYVKPVLVADLPEALRDKAGDVETLFAVHNTKGQQLALVADRDLAYALARQHDMRPQTLH